MLPTSSIRDSNDAGKSATPFSDEIYNIIANSGSHRGVTEELSGDCDGKPRGNPNSSLGIKKPVDVPEVVTEEGVHIFDGDISLRRAL